MSRQRQKRRPWWVAMAMVVVLGAGGWWLLRDVGPEIAGARKTPLPAPLAPAVGSADPHREPTCPLRWELAPSGDAVPASPCAGPWKTEDGRAAGFAHNRMGAVFAAINITTRLSAAAGAAVYRPTYAGQTVGDAQTALSELAREWTAAHSADTQPLEWWWRISAGDPAGELVMVELAAVTSQTAELGAVAHLSITLRWVEGDWKVQLPRPRATPVSTVDGYTSLGPIVLGGGR